LIADSNEWKAAVNANLPLLIATGALILLALIFTP
jgi:hypothetical protein